MPTIKQLTKLILLERGTKLKIKANKKSEFLFIAGKPIANLLQEADHL